MNVMLPANCDSLFCSFIYLYLTHTASKLESTLNDIRQHRYLILEINKVMPQTPNDSVQFII